MRLAAILAVLLILLSTCAFATTLDLTGIDVSQFSKHYNTLPPTPKGTDHLGPLESGTAVQIRYQLPRAKPLSYQIDFHNIVAYAGGGKSYQLKLHRDSPTGELLYDGPVMTSEPWNASHQRPIDITAHLKPADFARGYLDVFAVATVTGDTWTMYRDDDGGGHDLLAIAVDDSPALRRAIAQARLLRAKGIELIPTPQQVVPMSQDFAVTSKTRILLPADASPEDLFAAGLLRDEIAKLSGPTVPIRKGLDGRRKDDIVFRWAPKGEQAYSLRTGAGFDAFATDSTGLFYAVQTAMQLLRKQNGRVVFQGVSICDKPDLKYRMFQYDIARSQTVNVNYIKRVIREAARFKLNQILFYMEDDFRYTKYPFTGRPGTFTPEKVRELVAYARHYHVELVPELECLGHGAALLGHKEFADLRENGNVWDFCTSNPRTWEVLDNMIGELASVFDNTPFIHLGGDEFEWDFGRCPKCKKQIEKIGWGGLYAQHMSKLDEIARRHGRRMIFWPAHGADGPLAGDLTLKYASQVPRDMIPMEWIYHGPRDYPTIEQYQRAGFRSLYAAPAVVGYSRLYPDYETTFRGISGFYRAAARRKAMGGCTCTWELARGAQLETEWYGLIYSAQCAWNTRASDEGAFDRAFARQWLGLPGEKEGPRVRRVLRLAEVSPGDSPMWGDVGATAALFWEDFPKLKARAGGGWPRYLVDSRQLVSSADNVLRVLGQLKAQCTRNRETLDATENIARLYRATGRKVLAMEEAGRYYSEALDSSNRAAASDLIGKAIAALEPLRQDYAEIIAGFEQTRDQRGGAPQDVDRTRAVAQSLDDLLAKLKAMQQDPSTINPKPEELGL